MEARIISDRRQWDEFVAGAVQCNVTQSYEWGQLLTTLDGEVLYVGVVNDQGKMCAAMLLLVSRVAVSNSVYFYAPRGPIIDDPESPAMTVLLNYVKALAHKYHAFMLKVEPGVKDNDPKWLSALHRRGFVPNPEALHLRHEWVLDIRPDEQTLLAGMKKTWRYCVRLASRKDVTVRRGESLADINTFYQILQTTSQRDTFMIYDKSFYEKLVALYGQSQNVALFIAEYEGQALGAALLVKMGRWCWYMYGASSNEHRDRMPNHLLQWTAMRWAKEQGCWYYNFRGIPDVLEESQPMWGVYLFKSGFGGYAMRSLETHDLVYNPLLYRLYRGWLDGRSWLKDVRARRHARQSESEQQEKQNDNEQGKAAPSEAEKPATASGVHQAETKPATEKQPRQPGQRKQAKPSQNEQPSEHRDAARQEVVVSESTIPAIQLEEVAASEKPETQPVTMQEAGEVVNEPKTAEDPVYEVVASESEIPEIQLEAEQEAVAGESDIPASATQSALTQEVGEEANEPKVVEEVVASEQPDETQPDLAQEVGDVASELSVAEEPIHEIVASEKPDETQPDLAQEVGDVASELSVAEEPIHEVVASESTIPETQPELDQEAREVAGETDIQNSQVEIKPENTPSTEQRDVEEQPVYKTLQSTWLEFQEQPAQIEYGQHNQSQKAQLEDQQEIPASATYMQPEPQVEQLEFPPLQDQINDDGKSIYSETQMRIVQVDAPPTGEQQGGEAIEARGEPLQAEHGTREAQPEQESEQVQVEELVQPMITEQLVGELRPGFVELEARPIGEQTEREEEQGKIMVQDESKMIEEQPEGEIEPAQVEAPFAYQEAEEESEQPAIEESVERTKTKAEEVVKELEKRANARKQAEEKLEKRTNASKQAEEEAEDQEASNEETQKLPRVEMAQKYAKSRKPMGPNGSRPNE